MQHALFLAWKATAHICAKRLVPYLPDLVVDLERCGYLQLSEEHRCQLLAMSATTAERLLRAQCMVQTHHDWLIQLTSWQSKQAEMQSFGDRMRAGLT